MTNISQPYFQALLEISEQINSIKKPEELLESILDIAINHLSAERGFILLKDNKNEEDFETRAVRNIGTLKIEEVKDISHSTVKKVLKESKPLLSFDTPSDKRFDDAQSIVLHKIQSIAAVPLILKGEMIGVIYIDSRDQKAKFTRQSLDFLQVFANQAAIALENARLISLFQQENALLKEEFHRIYAFKEIIGKSKVMQQVFQMMGKVLNNETTVLLFGETGTGKELVARGIHFNGIRDKKPFVPVNCGAIPENLLESELFGHKKGSFTGAVSDKTGLIEMANGGTLFLDEIGELPLSMQVKLLRFLQDKQYVPIGDTRVRLADVRIISATNKNLEDSIRSGEFREDLYYRLHVINIAIPPIRERKKDIPLLVHHFLKKYNNSLVKQVSSVSTEAMNKIVNHDWPGNVRELENAIERAIVLDTDLIIGEDDLMFSIGKDKSAGIEAGLTLEKLSKKLLEKTLRAVDFNKTKAAEMMGVSLRWIHYKMKEWDLN